MRIRELALAEVCDINPRLPRDHGLSDADQVSFVPMSAIDAVSGRIVQRLTRPYGEVRRGYTVFRDRDVLFAKITPCMENGKAACVADMVGGWGFGSTEFHVLRARELVLPEWLYFFVRRESFRQQAMMSFTGTAGQKRVPTDYMAAVRIPVPPLDDQRKRVAAMTCAERLAGLRRESIVKGDELVRALHTEMFGDASTNPRKWPIRTLGEVLEFDGGRSPRCEERPRRPGEWGVLRLSALTGSNYDESDHKTLPASQAPDPRHEVHAKDLLISRKNTLELVGTPAYVWKTGGRMLMPDLMFRLRPREDAGLHPLYLWGLLASATMRERMRLLASGTAASMLNISQARLRGLSIMVPPLERQQRFARHVSALHSISRQHAAGLAATRKLIVALAGRTFDPNRFI